MTLILLTILITFSLVFVLEPLFSKPSEISEKEPPSIRELEEKKRILLKEIKDLEIEKKAGKITEEEYQEVREDLEDEISSIIEEIESTEG